MSREAITNLNKSRNESTWELLDLKKLRNTLKPIDKYASLSCTHTHTHTHTHIHISSREGEIKKEKNDIKWTH
jgi:hypothetical protein